MADTDSARGRPAARAPRRPHALLSSQTPLDYLADEALAAFFAAREHVEFYLSIKYAQQRREFRSVLLPVLMHALNVIDERASVAIDAILRPGSGRALTDASAPATYLARLEPEGARLLALPRTFDYSALRLAYRRAAREHHPDRGGSHAHMVAINRAHDFAHNLLSTHTYGGEDTSEYDAAPRNTRQFAWLLKRVLFEAAVDDWALDEAARWLRELASDLDRTFEPTNEGGDAHNTRQAVARRASVSRRRAKQAGRSLRDRRLIDLIEPAGTLARRLFRANMHDLGVEALTIAETGVTCASRSGLRFSEYLEGLRPVADRRKTVRRQRPRLVHERQLANARRLGLIDDTEHEALLKSLLKPDRDRQQRLVFLRQCTFARLPVDPHEPPETEPSRLTPHPAYFQTAGETLSPSQQSEYLKAFGEQPALPLIEKYAWVRLSVLLRSTLYFPDAVDPGQLANEARNLAALQPHCADYAGRAARLLVTLSEAEEYDVDGLRSALIQTLDPESGRGDGKRIVLTPGVISVGFFDLAEKLLADYQKPAS